MFQLLTAAYFQSRKILPFKLFVICLLLTVSGCKKGNSKPDTSNGNDSTYYSNGEFDVVNMSTNKSFLDVYFSDDANGIICGAFGYLAITDNGGKTWNELNVGIGDSFLSAFMLGNNDIFTARVGIYNSKDVGNTFKEVGGLSSYSNSIFAIHFFKQDIGFIIKGNLILKTNDGGNTWSLVYDKAQFLSILQFTSDKIVMLQVNKYDEFAR